MSDSTHPYADLAGPNLLVAWRSKIDLSQQEAANKIGCDLAQYNAFETGRARPGIDWAVEIAKATSQAVRPDHWSRIPKSIQKATAKANQRRAA